MTCLLHAFIIITGIADAIVKCFIKSTRLMQFRANKSYDEKSGKDSRSFLEHNNAEFQEILDAMKSGKISVLENYQEFFEMMAQKTGYYHNKAITSINN